MRPMQAFFSLAFFITIASAAANSSGYQEGAKLFGYQLAQQGAGFSVENFTCNGEAGYAIVSYGEPAAFFELGGQQEDFPGIIPATDAGAIAGYLHCYYAERGRKPSPLDGFSKVHAEIAKLQDDDDRGEAGCRILLGTDRTQCVSFETCQRACYSVTSFCQPFALGVGRAFVNEIWMFENNSRALDRAYAGEGEAYAAFAKNASEANALAYLSAANETFVAAQRAAMSPLFYDYSYCFSPDYPIYGLYVLNARAAKQYQDSAVFYSIGGRSKEIANRTMSAMAKKAKYRLPEIEETGGEGRANRTLEGGGDGGQAQAQSFVAGFLNGILLLFQSLVPHG
ncbi:MAG: hypothetical protein WC263_02450 [Candidatus Micrarchaeia archaeon]|jgi:hypothetical protein